MASIRLSTLGTSLAVHQFEPTWVRKLPHFSPAVQADSRSAQLLLFPGSPTSQAAFCSWEPGHPSQGAGRSRKLLSSVSPSST